MSRARLGLYVFCRQALFGSCYELAPTFGQLMSKPNRLCLVPGEVFPTSRAADAIVHSVPVESLSQFGMIVQQMAITALQASRGTTPAHDEAPAAAALPPAAAEAKAATPAPPAPTTSAVVITSEAAAVDEGAATPPPAEDVDTEPAGGQDAAAPPPDVTVSPPELTAQPSASVPTPAVAPVEEPEAAAGPEPMCEPVLPL